MRRKNKTIMTALATLCLAGGLAGCDGRGGRGAGHTGQERAAVSFTHLRRLPATPVKDQGAGPLCWLYAMLATIESEHLAQGDSVNLSPLYNARRYMERLALQCHLDPRHDTPSMRGMAPMALRLLEADGAMPYDSYWAPRAPSYNAVMRRMALAARRRALLADIRRAVDSVADQQMGCPPTHIYMLGAEYSTRDFAQSVCLPGEWQGLTSVTHHPFYTRVPLEVPDNRMADTFYNVPLDTLVARVDASLRAGHPVCWEGDISEPGFDWPRGLADTPPAVKATQRERQRQIELLQTTDDHCLCLLGTARGSDGQRWYLAKNSWGEGNALGGYVMLSERYLRLKTLVVMVNRAFLKQLSPTGPEKAR